MVKRSLMVISAALALCCALACGCSSNSFATQPASSGGNDSLPRIVIGCDTYPPYVYNDENGNATGIDVDIMTEAFHRIGYEPEFKYISWEEKNDLLESGAIDCIASSFSMTGRESLYRWAGPYMKSRQVIAVAPSSDIASLADLEGKIIGVQSTTKPETILLEHSNDAVPQVDNVISFSNRNMLAPALVKGYVDAIGAHETSILQYAKDYGFECRILDEPLAEVGLGCAFSLNDTRGIDRALDGALKEMRRDGTLEGILSAYFDDPSKYLDMEGLDD